MCVKGLIWLCLMTGIVFGAQLSWDWVDSNGLKMRPIEFPPTNRPVRVAFIHAAVGVFTYTRKDRLGQTWGHGEDILIEIIDKILNNRRLVNSLDWVYIGMLGASSDIEETLEMLNSRYKTDVALTADGKKGYKRLRGRNNRKKIRVVLEGVNKYMWEFPTLSLLQTYASYVHPESEILYVHTKGVRRNAPSDDTITDWREYMLYWVVERHDLCRHVMSRGAQTCGAIKSGGDRACYGGNFWWAKAQYLSNKRPLIAKIDWSINITSTKRFGAEEWLLKNEYLKGIKSEGSQHYCLHTVHQDMRFCHIPPEWYRLDLLNKGYVYRENGNCWKFESLPKNSTRDTATWCHKNGFPEVE